MSSVLMANALGLSPEETGFVAVLAAVGAYCLYSSVKELVWDVLTRLFPDTVDVEAEEGDGLGVACDFEPADPALVVNWHTRHAALQDPAMAKTLASWSTAAAGIPIDLLVDDLCDRCLGTGLVEVLTPGFERPVTVTCTSCRGEWRAS